LFNTLEHVAQAEGGIWKPRIRSGLRVARQSYQQRMVKGRGERIISG
jgi:hypothetical protein